MKNSFPLLDGIRKKQILSWREIGLQNYQYLILQGKNDLEALVLLSIRLQIAVF